MTVNQLHQVPATRPMKGCFQSFDRIAQSGVFLPCFAGCTPTAHRHDRRFPIHSVCIPIIAPSYELRAGGLVGLRSKTSLEFGFRTREGGGTSHHLVYATKEVRALNKMKRIYTKASSDQCDGVGSLDYDPRDAGASALLFSPLDEVRQRLLQTFAGRTLTVDELTLAEGPHTTFTDTAYRNALLELEEERGVAMEPSAEHRRFQPGGERRTLPGSTRITFPDLKEGN